jgi:DNA-binding beta-propeller fold protein YncE
VRRGADRLRFALLAATFALGACGGDPEVIFGLDAGAVWPQPPLLPPVTAPRLAFTDSGDDTVFFADLAGFSEIAKVPVGTSPLEREGPHHLAASADGRFLYVGISNVVPPDATSSGPHGSHGQGAEDGYLLQLDSRTGRQVGRIRVGRSPGDVRLEPSGTRVWQSHFDLFRIQEVLQQGGVPDLAKMNAPVIVTRVPEMKVEATLYPCPASHGLAFSETRRETYVACDYSDEIAVIDTATLELKALIPVASDPGVPPLPHYEPYAVAVDPGTGLLWVSNVHDARSWSLSVIDPAAGAALPERAVHTTGAPFFSVFTADGSRLYVPTQNPDHLLEIDPASSAILREVDLAPTGCKLPHGAWLSADGAQVWVVCEGDHTAEPGSLEVLERASLEPVHHLPLGLYPDDLVVLPVP